MLKPAATASDRLSSRGVPGQDRFRAGSLPNCYHSLRSAKLRLLAAAVRSRPALIRSVHRDLCLLKGRARRGQLPGGLIIVDDVLPPVVVKPVGEPAAVRQAGHPPDMVGGMPSQPPAAAFSNFLRRGRFG